MSNTTPTTNTLPGIDSNMVIKCVVFGKRKRLNSGEDHSIN